MRLFIVRHGEAAFDAKSDRLRPLTERGRADCKRQVTEHLSTLSEVTTIWCSELLRAQQTAEIFAQHLSVQIESKRFLSPDTDPALVLKALDELPETTSLLMVSHQPLVGCLVSLLCAGHVYDAHPFATSEMVSLNVDMPAEGLATLESSWRV